MKHLTQSELNEVITLKLDTTRAICNAIVDSNLTNLPDAAKLEFGDIMELVVILMLEYAGKFPEEWTSEELTNVYHHKLPTLLTVEERQHVKDILMTYLEFVGTALELPHYKEIQKDLAS